MICPPARSIQLLALPIPLHVVSPPPSLAQISEERFVSARTCLRTQSEAAAEALLADEGARVQGLMEGAAQGGSLDTIEAELRRSGGRGSVGCTRFWEDDWEWGLGLRRIRYEGTRHEGAAMHVAPASEGTVGQQGADWVALVWGRHLIGYTLKCMLGPRMV